MRFDIAPIVIWIFELPLDQEIRAVRVIRILLGLERGLVVVAIAEDTILRQAYAEFANPEFTKIIGLSGSPVFNASCNKLVGMAVRGALTGKRGTLWYIDMFDILTFVTAVAEGREATDYTKVVTRLTRRLILDEP
jgi:hypothetical protein